MRRAVKALTQPTMSAPRGAPITVAFMSRTRQRHSADSCTVKRPALHRKTQIKLEDLDLQVDIEEVAEGLLGRCADIREALHAAYIEARASVVAGTVLRVTLADSMHQVHATYCACGRETLKAEITKIADPTTPPVVIDLDHLSAIRNRPGFHRLDDEVRAIVMDAAQELHDHIYFCMPEGLPEQLSNCIRAVVDIKHLGKWQECTAPNLRRHLAFIAFLVFTDEGTDLRDVADRMMRNWKLTASDLISSAQAVLQGPCSDVV